ncbi:MAG: hypothetical protein OIF57_17015 [Marinobacterium sp.]|nr:hypothetical protein [Marinobacterium sp.]
MLRTVLVHNQKVAVLSHQARSAAVFNEGFLQLAAHDGFTPRTCRPQRPRISLSGEMSVYDISGQLLARYILHAASEGW